MRGVRKEINYSEPCSNATDKAQLSLGCTHLSTCPLVLQNWHKREEKLIYTLKLRNDDVTG